MTTRRTEEATAARLSDEDRAFIAYLVTKAIETCVARSRVPRDGPEKHEHG